MGTKPESDATVVARPDWAAEFGVGSPDASVVLDGQFVPVWRSPSAALLTGVTDDAAGSVVPATRIHPDDLGAFVEAIQQARGTGECSPVEFRMHSPDGDRWFECTGWMADVSHLVPDHTLVRFTVRTHDRDWSRAGSLDPFLALTESSSLGFAVVGEKGVIGYRNPTFAGWFPTDTVTLMGDLATMVRPEHRAATASWVADLLAGEDRLLAVAVDSVDGTTTWLDLEAATRSSNWSQSTIGITAHDITGLRHEATHDHLSGMLNRPAVIAALDVALADARSDGSNVGVLFCDLDNFKLVNDGLGHEVGDELLVRVSRRILSAVRSDDLVGRLGGDEFLVVTRDVRDEDDLVALAGRIARAVSDDLRGSPFPVSLSIGAALARSGRSSTGALVRDADAAMYRAKVSGKARTEVFRAEMRDRAERRLEVGRLLRTALDEGWITVNYQPIFHRCGNRWLLHSLEALARCSLPSGRHLLPDEFIPVAEQTGLISRLGSQVRRQVATDLARWSHTHGDGFRVWVNMSVQELDRAHLAERLGERLAELGLEPHRLGVEVTESTLASGHHVALANLAHLRGMGMEVIIDDFGTGYSSLGALKNYPADVIKIDRQFIAGILDDPADLAIVRSVTDIGEVSGLDVVAEGVETESQLDALIEVGCSLVQGYHLGRPVPAPQVDERIGTWLRGAFVTT